MPPPIDQELLAGAESFRELIIGDVQASVAELERTICDAGVDPMQLQAIYLAATAESGSKAEIIVAGREGARFVRNPARHTQFAANVQNFSGFFGGQSGGFQGCD